MFHKEIKKMCYLFSWIHGIYFSILLLLSYFYIVILGHIYINIILEKQIPTSVLKTFKHDNDPFVRSKALECLENMVGIKDIWETFLKDSDLIVSLI